MKTQAWAIALVLSVSIVTATAAFFLKRGANASLFRFSGWKIDPRLFVGLGLYLLASLLYLTALKGGDLSVLFPLVSLEYVWASLLAVWQLNEKIGRAKGAGLAAIVLGVAFIGLGAR